MDNRNPGQHWQSTTPPHRPTPFKQSSHAPHCLAVAVVLALGTLVAERAEAGGSCPGTHTVINGATTSACTLGSAASVNVTEQGAIEPTSGTAIGVVGTAAGQVRNAGTLKGNTGIGLSGNDAGSGSLSGKLYNTATGHITADFGVHVANSQIAGSVTNAGSISSGAEDGAGMLFENARVGGNLSNTGNISVGFGAQGLTVLDSSLDGDLINSGAISGGATGLRVANAIIDGSVRNAGSLAGGSNPLLVTGSFIRGDLVNSGSTGGTAALFDSTVLGRFVNSGSMSDGVTALRIQNMTISGGIVNTGEINSGEGVSITNSRFSSLHNSGTFYVSSGNLGLSNNTITGSIVNSGWLGSGTDGYGALALYGGVVGGEVKNTGTLDGGNFGVALRGEQDAFVFGNIINSGSMLAQTAVKLTATHIGGSFINTGSIVGNRDFIERQGSGVVLALSDIHDDFLNRGSISGLTRAVQLSEVKISGNFINRGSLVAPHGAVALNKANVVGSFSNYGHIGTELTPNTDPDDYDPNSRGLQISSSTLEGPLTNQGSIVGSSIGVEVLGSTLSQGLVNAGLLKGDAYSLYISPDSQVNGLYIAGNNTARFAGAVYAPGTTAYLYSNATYTLAAGDSWTVDSLVNRGTLVLGRPATRGTVASVTGDYVQGSGAVLRTQVKDNTHYGQLVVSGTATLPSQARIDVDVANASQPFTVSRLQNVLSAGSLQSDGTFAVTSNSALFDFGAVKDANTVDLTLSAKSTRGVSAAAAANGLKGASGAAQVLDQQLALGSASALTPYFVSATSNAEVASSLAQTLPQNNDSLRASQAALSAIGLAVQERMGIANGLLGADGLANQASFWSKPFSYASGHGGGSQGSVMGMDTRLSPTSRAGFAFAYANGENANPQGQSSQLDLWQFLGYRSYALAPNTELMLYAGAGNNTVEGERTLNLAGASGTAKGSYDSVTATVGASLGHSFQLSEQTRLLPALRLDFNHIRDEAYREHGADSLSPLLLEVDARRSNQLIAGLDGTLGHQFTPRTALKLNLGVGYDLINDDGAVRAAFAGAPGQRFTVAGEQASPWLLRSGAGLATTFSNGAELSVNYDAQTRSDFTDQTASVRFSLPF